MNRLSSMSCKELTTLLPGVSQGKALKNLGNQLFVRLGLKAQPTYRSKIEKNAHKIIASQATRRDILLIALPILAIVSVYFGVKTKHALVTFAAGSLAVSIKGAPEEFDSVESRLYREEILEQLSNGTCPALTLNHNFWKFNPGRSGSHLLLFTNPDYAQFVQAAITHDWKVMRALSDNPLFTNDPDEIQIGTIDAQNYAQYAALLKRALDLGKSTAFTTTPVEERKVSSDTSTAMSDYALLRFRYTELLARFEKTTPSFTEEEQNSKEFWTAYASNQPVNSAAQIDLSFMSKDLQEDTEFRNTLFSKSLDCNWIVLYNSDEDLSEDEVSILLSERKSLEYSPSEKKTLKHLRSQQRRLKTAMADYAPSTQKLMRPMLSQQWSDVLEDMLPKDRMLRHPLSAKKILRRMSSQQVIVAIQRKQLKLTYWPDHLLKTEEQWNMLTSTFGINTVRDELSELLSRFKQLLARAKPSPPTNKYRPAIWDWKPETPDWVKEEYAKLTSNDEEAKF